MVAARLPLASSPATLLGARVTAHSLRSLSSSSRTYIRAASVRGRPGPPTRALKGPIAAQSRWLFSGGISRNQLASLEASANSNPGNANTQNAFYQLLLKANMPGIIVERHKSGYYASNATTEELYSKALIMTSGSGGGAAATISSVNTVPGGRTTLDIAANSGRGMKGEPIHVIVQESTLAAISRWIKFILVFSAATYLSFVVVTIIVDSMTVSGRRVPAKNDSEVKPEKQLASFSDVHGCEEAKEELQDVIEFLRNPDSFSDLGAKLPKGVLLVGPPGTGKTLLARAAAGEAGVPFFYMSGSEFDEVFVGVGAKRVRDLFNAAKAKSPSIIFIDELDAIGGRRNPRDPAYAKQTLNQLLTEMDGFHADSKVIVIAATNLPESLDKALTRPGRFDRHVNVDLPDVRGRLAILKHHAKKVKLAPDAELDSFASRTSGRSGADLENLLNLAALHASKAKAAFISKLDLDWAYDRMTMGHDKRSLMVDEKDKEMTAYHEAGHALIQLLDPESPAKLYKVTILPKGPSLGHTAFIQKGDKVSVTAAEYLSQIRVCLGGKMAEEMVYGNDNVTSGVSADLAHATDLCFMMVGSFGMSNILGPMEFRRRYDQLSSETRSQVEAEVQKTLKKSYEEVRVILTARRKELDLLAQALVQYETLDKSEVEKVIRGEKLEGRAIIPKGPMVVPVPVDADEPPHLGGITQSPTVPSR
ncbi:intermembrane space AAA protease IAP-1 [Stachybotrys elegans]|uniref:Intermembrane space AAA protease IAP-1 n=1 Tax=Stachybotrys elegans TaxID=80388 RepID=A0A8K0SXL0_9HYPO|nr:intermembrane space AAA protease IAP-1 [Stachybotrys elegans]